MTSRRKGRRHAVVATARRSVHQSNGRRVARRSDMPLRSKERRQLIQLVICGSIFVILVAVKLFLPQRMAQINGVLSNAMEQNMDVQAVFSAVGQAFSGDKDMSCAANEVYQAVFAEEKGETAEMVIHMADAQKLTALEELREYRKISASDVEEQEVSHEQSEEQVALSALTYLLYSDQNLPENASMAQAMLGFDYCTPVSGTLSSPFGYREHPMEGEDRFHYGVDLAANTGTEILSFADGTVTAVGESSSYGKYCMVSHKGGYSTLYAHCSRIVAASGDKVTRGEKIAEVGETGMATGPHLHFELQQEGTYLNPIYYVSGG